MRSSWDWKGLFRDLVEVRGSELQLPQYAAVVAGVRKSIDDWVPIDRFNAYKRFAASAGLVVLVDCIFSPITNSDSVLGINYAPTTRARGGVFDSSVKDPHASVHVVVSTRADWADDTLAAAWYSVAVENRVLTKPKIDHARLGLAFGYPECCVRSFISHNNWGRECTLTEAARMSREIYWETNCLPKNTPWMTIFHLPCAFDCPGTRTYSRDVIHAVSDIDPAYASHIRSFMKQIYLVINEKLAYALVGGVMIGTNRVIFKRAVDVYANTVFREPHYDHWSRALETGNQVLVTGDSVVVSNEDAIVEVLELRCDRGIVEIPLLLNFE